MVERRVAGRGRGPRGAGPARGAGGGRVNKNLGAGRGGAGRGRGRGAGGGRGRGGRSGAKPTKEQLDKELDAALMKDDETRERLLTVKKQTLDEEMDKFAAQAEKGAEEAAAPAEEKDA